MFGGMGSGGSVEKQPSIDGANDAITIISQQPSTTNNDSSSSSKALFKIELDDVVEKDNIYYLLDYGRTNKKDLYTCSTEFMPGLDKFDSNVQMFTSVYRCEISQTQTLNQVKLNEICEEILETLRYQYRYFNIPNYILYQGTIKKVQIPSVSKTMFRKSIAQFEFIRRRLCYANSDWKLSNIRRNRRDKQQQQQQLVRRK